MNVISFLKKTFTALRTKHTVQRKQETTFVFSLIAPHAVMQVYVPYRSLLLILKEYIVKRWLTAVTFDFVSAKIVVDIGHGY